MTIKRHIALDLLDKPLWWICLDDFLSIVLDETEFDTFIDNISDDDLLELTTKYYNLFRNIFDIHNWVEYVQLSVDDSDLVETIKEIINKTKEVE